MSSYKSMIMKKLNPFSFLLVVNSLINLSENTITPTAHILLHHSTYYTTLFRTIMSTKRLGVPTDANCLSLSLGDKNRCTSCSLYKEYCVFKKKKKRPTKCLCKQHWNRLPKEKFKDMSERRQRVFIQVWEELDELGYKLDPAYTYYKKKKGKQKDVHERKARRTNQQQNNKLPHRQSSPQTPSKIPPTSSSSKRPSTLSISQRSNEYSSSPLYSSSDVLNSFNVYDEDGDDHQEFSKPSSPVSSFKLRPLAAPNNNKTNKKRKNVKQGRNGGLLSTPSPFKKAQKKDKHASNSKSI